jgi:serine/threonine-protein kinase SRPK3
VGSFTLVRENVTVRFGAIDITPFNQDLKPENVLICIDDVESIIQSELGSTSPNALSPPTRLVGVPPSKGRGGNQTPRSESVFITGSQPLPSPSSSFGSSPMLDKWAFGMSQIRRGDGKPTSLGSAGGRVGGFIDVQDKTKRTESTELAQLAAEHISISAPDTFGSKTLTPHPAIPPGPSLLTQQAPSHNIPIVLPTLAPDGIHFTLPPPAPLENSAIEVPLSSSAMSVDSRETPSSVIMEPTERITVKIADLGNGERGISQALVMFY